MSAASQRRRASALCGALLMLATAATAVATEPPGQAIPAQAGMPSAAALQRELIRRINAAEPVSGLFLPLAAVPDVASWRSIALLQDKSATPLSPAQGGDTARVRLRVKMGRQLPLTADCPVVDALLSADGNMRVWDETGWMQATYRRSGRSWRIASLVYSPD